MRNTSAQPWIQIARIDSILQPEPLVLIVCLLLVGAAILRFVLKDLSQERHRLLSTLFRDAYAHVFILVALTALHEFLRRGFPEAGGPAERIAAYVGLAAIIFGASVFVKTARILTFEYLFFNSMRAGVPVLLVNLFTLLISIVLGGWMLSEIFAVKVGPLLATSAIFSIVLGLALQDTLGNLFAGVALQFDKPYEIGDWIEVQNTPQKWVGQVNEITWRATVLIGLMDETLTIPNRVISQSQISNFSTKVRPFCRAQLWRIPYGASIETAKRKLLSATEGVPGICRTPAPLTLISECNESCVTVRLVYFLDDYGAQFTISDRVSSNALKALFDAGIEVAPPRLEMHRRHDTRVAT